MQFQLHVSESKAERGDLHEKIAILKAGKKAQSEKLQLILNEMEILKTQNRNQMARIDRLEENLLKGKSAKSSATSPIQMQSVTKPKKDVGSSNISSSCEDLKSLGHYLNAMYMIFDANVKKVLATYCDFQQSSEFSRSIISHQTTYWTSLKYL